MEGEGERNARTAFLPPSSPPLVAQFFSPLSFRPFKKSNSIFPNSKGGEKEKNLRSLRFQRRGQKVCVLFHCLLFHPSRAPQKKEKQPLCSSFLFPPFRLLSSISRINQESFLPPPQISMLIARPTGPKREKRSGRG